MADEAALPLEDEARKSALGDGDTAERCGRLDMVDRIFASFPRVAGRDFAALQGEAALPLGDSRCKIEDRGLFETLNFSQKIRNVTGRGSGRGLGNDCRRSPTAGGLFFVDQVPQTAVKLLQRLDKVGELVVDAHCLFGTVYMRHAI